MQVYEAIAEMERLTKLGQTFSFSFYKYNRQNGKGGDLARISRAKLRSKASDNKRENSSYKLAFYDLDTNKALECWQPLIVEFNGQKLTL
jgi:hypothetical protein